VEYGGLHAARKPYKRRTGCSPGDEKEGPVRRLVTALIVVFVAVAVRAAAAGASELRLDPNLGAPDLWSGAEVLRDPTGGWDLATVEAHAAEFRPASQLAPAPSSGGFAPAALWFRLVPRSAAAQRWYLDIDLNVDSGEIVYRAPNGRVERSAFGMRVPYADRPYASYRVVAPVPAGALRDGTLYVRTVSRLSRFGTFSIRSEAWLRGAAQRAEREVLVPLLLTAGMILALALLNCVLAVTLRDGIYLWYAVAMFAFVLYDAAQSGTAWEFLWPRLSLSYDITTYLTMIAYFGFVVGFCRSFLDLPRTAPLLWRGIVACFVLLAVEELVYAFAPDAIDRAGLYAVLDPLATTLLLIVVFAAGIVAWRRGNPLARYYCLAFAGVVIGMAINVSGVYDLIHHTAMTDAAAGVGVAWEAVFLSVALADRIRGLNLRAATLQGERDAFEVVALRDGLTGVANRRAFELRLDEEWRHGARTNARLAVVILDVDHFKKYNDALGHPRGDRVLFRVAHAVAGVLRRPEDFVARYGGEEFVVILPNCGRDDAARIAEEMRGAVRRLAIPHAASDSGFVTISAGVSSVVPRHDAGPMALISAADRALYSAKRDGRDRIAVARLSPRWYA
jgi:diguanylate cyclase (GGDEF)-like protein